MTIIPITPFTKLPNALVDRYLPELTGAQVKVLVALIRQTLGYQRRSTTLSTRDLCRLTGIQSRDTITRALHKLTILNLITTEGQPGQSKSYTLTDHALKGAHDQSYDLSDNRTPPQIGQVSEEAPCPEIGQVHLQSDTPCPINGHPKAQESDTPCTKNERPPVQKSDTPNRKNKERSIEKEEKEKIKDKEIRSTSIPPLGILPEEKKSGGGDGLADAEQEAVKALVAFGLWETSARKIVRERNLTPEGVARAIEAVTAEARGGVGVRSPAGLLRKRLESGWEPPEVRPGSYPASEEPPPKRPDPPPPDFMRATFLTADGRRRFFGPFSQALMETLEMQLPREAFTSWLRPARFTGCTVADGKLTGIQLELVSAQAQEWVATRLRKTLERTAAGFLGHPVNWTFTCRHEAKEEVA